jgi:hypothetical protein
MLSSFEQPDIYNSNEIKFIGAKRKNSNPLYKHVSSYSRFCYDAMERDLENLVLEKKQVFQFCNLQYDQHNNILLNRKEIENKNNQCEKEALNNFPLSEKSMLSVKTIGEFKKLRKLIKNIHPEKEDENYIKSSLNYYSIVCKKKREIKFNMIRKVLN